jgi:hypothetical protein
LLLALYGVTGALTLLSAVPVLLVSMDMTTIKTFDLGWFSYSMTWDSLADGILGNTFPSAHTLFVALVGLHLTSRLLVRRPAEARAQVQTEKAA